MKLKPKEVIPAFFGLSIVAGLVAYHFTQSALWFGVIAMVLAFAISITRSYWIDQR